MNTKKIVESIIEYFGGKQNIISVTNCMTRLRIETKQETLVDEAGLKDMEAVLALIHDRECYYEVVVGPGRSRKYADICHDAGIPAAATDADMNSDSATDSDNASIAFEADGDWKQNKEKIKSAQKENKIKTALKTIGDIFVPLIPGVIAAGLCAGFASLISQLVPNYAEIPVWNVIFNVLSLINVSFMTYITAWVGYRAAERFGATPVLGGMLGLITSLDGINTLSRILGLYNESQPLQSILRTGKGGVLAVIIGVLLLSYVEKKIRNHMPESVDIVFTPLLSLIIVVVPYILIIMPLFGYVSSAIVWAFGKACLSGSIIVRLITGYLASALFLPLVAAGMHHGMVALYSVQLQEIGCITLYPALAMAGAGQVGAALAILKKAKQKNNVKLVSVIRGALPAGFLGVGEPLIYGVTLPLGKPFITAGLGAGFGGAFVMLMQVASTTWGPSGLLGVFVMTKGPHGAVISIVCYLVGLLISYIMSFIITNAFVKADEVTPSAQAVTVLEKTETQNSDYRKIMHGENINISEEMNLSEGMNTKEKMKTENLQHKKVKHGEIIIQSGELKLQEASFGKQIELSKESQPQESSFRKIGHGEPITAADFGDTEFSYVIKDPVGIHARPAGELAQIIKKYNCRFVIEANGKTAENGSVIQMMALGAVQGTELKCSAEGPDSAEAIKEVRAFMESSL